MREPTLLQTGVRQRIPMMLGAVLGVGVLFTVPAMAASKTRGFVISTYEYAKSKNDDKLDCPKGFALSASDVYLLSVSPAEKERLLKPENMRELNQLSDSRGVPGLNSCRNPTAVKDPPFPETQSKTAYGLNLDGAVGGNAPNTCAHKEFVSPTGEPGVDNNLWRLLACVEGYRTEFFDDYRNTEMRRNQRPILVNVTGIDDERNDPEVMVTFGNGTDPMVVDTAGLPLANGSYIMGVSPKPPVTVKGKIVNGVLTSDPFDTTYNASIETSTVRGARLRLELTPDGGAKGLIAGYYDVKSWVSDPQGRNSASQYANKYSCPAFNEGAWRLADGYPDPQTGKCTAISFAMSVIAKPAYIFPAEGAKP
jgi:hypothetical protein